MHEQTRIVSTADGRSLAVCVWGDPDGAPMFWLHGTPGSRFLREPGDAYARNHLRVYTYDRPGYGHGGHFGPRYEAEMELMTWVGHGTDPTT